MDQPEHGLLTPYPVVIRIPVQWGEMDAYGHVNNTVYFRYFESARIAYLERCGFIESYESAKIGAILHSTQCRFKKPLRYPDNVLVGGRAIQIDDDRFTMGYAVISLSSDEIVAEGTGVIVSFDYTTGRKTPLPQLVRDRIALMETAMES
ncbi:MAG: acyl-CoA thioesterase [Gemmatimonadales bacterium]